MGRLNLCGQIGGTAVIGTGAADQNIAGRDEFDTVTVHIALKHGRRVTGAKLQQNLPPSVPPEGLSVEGR